MKALVSWWTLLLGAVVTASSAWAWTPVVVADDPLVRMPGTQPADGVSLDAPSQCMNCHDNYDPQVDPGFHWRGSMMSQAMRDPLFLAALTVAAQDSIWAVGRPNATDLCLRCHTPSGWLGGRSDPTNGQALTGADFDGVFCEGCHKLYDPFFEDTYAGVREGSDWLGYWDETDASGTPSSAAAFTTLQADRSEAASVSFFNGNAFYDAGFQPQEPGWLEHGGGQYFMAASGERRAPFADANANHSIFYSRHHKSRYFCASCHDVSNPVLANLAYDGTSPGDGVTVLPSETDSAHAYGHIERTFSEFMLSAYGRGAGAAGIGPYAPGVFNTSRPGNLIATCQDCHMPDVSGKGCDKNGGVDRPAGSVEHPNSGQPLHDLTGGNMWVPWLLASAVPGSPNYDAFNEQQLAQGPALLTLDLSQGEALDPDALLDGVARAQLNLQDAASIDALSYDDLTGALLFRVQNNTGHKLISGYPEGRRMFLNVRGYLNGVVQHEVNPYSAAAATLVGLPPADSPNSPPLGPQQVHDDALVYEVKASSSLTGESHTFHMALATERYKDNRIPPLGFDDAAAAARLTEPVYGGVSLPGYFTSAEYAGGYDAIQLGLPTGLDGVEVSLYYQTTSREYVEFLRDEINGVATTLFEPTPSGEPSAYIAQSDPFFDQLAAWGTTMWLLWDHNKNVPGAAPVLMTQAIWGDINGPCSAPGSDGLPCTDGDLCTQTDSCQGGVCVGSNPVVCSASDQCHDVGVCNAGTGVCSDPPKANGSGCTDGDLCTQTDSCQGGVCVGSNPVVCSASDECHDVGVCAAGTGVCSDPPKADGAPCAGGSCVAGVCIPSGTGGAGGQGGSGGQGGQGGSGGSAVGGSGGSAVGGSGGSALGGNGGSALGGNGGSAVGGSGGSAVGGSGGSAVGGQGGGGTAAGAPTGGSGGMGVGGSAGQNAKPADAPAEEGGCGCRLAGTAQRKAPGWLLFGALALAFAGRRRRRRV